MQYGNPCLAETNGATDCVSGECSDSCVCTADYVPVCCGDTTYGNVCNAECADEDLVACRYGECDESIDECEDLCPDKVKPICCDGKEYANKCLAECDGQHPRKCDKGTCPYAAASVMFSKPMSDPLGSAYQYGFLNQSNINTVLLALILLVFASFVCGYYHRTAPAKFQKVVGYDDSVESDQ